MEKGLQKKFGADVSDLADPIYFALGVAHTEARQLGVALVITSARDGQHKPGSLHYSGCAVDLRTRDLKPDARKSFYEYLKGLLDEQGFDVLLESDHIHLEWDPKKGDVPWLQEVA